MNFTNYAYELIKDIPSDVFEGLTSIICIGGIGSKEDNVYKFKAAFNRNSDYQFSIGKEIFDQKKYDELVAERASGDSNFDSESKFFPLYRS